MLHSVEKYLALAALGMLTFCACRRSDVPMVEKSPICLTAGVTGDTPAVTKAVTAVGTGSPLDKGTSFYMVLKSEKDNSDPLFSRTIGFTEASVVKFASQYGRFWEDSYSRNSQLSVLAVCVPGYYLDASLSQDAIKSGTVDATTWTLGGSNDYDNQWATNNGSTTISWPLRNVTAQNQDVDFVNSQDLCFSNNVSDLGSEDKRVVFSDEHKKFGSGLMVFYHALSRVTFKIKKGEGFEENEKFEFSNQDENVVLKGFNSSGTFNPFLSICILQSTRLCKSIPPNA